MQICTNWYPSTQTPSCNAITVNGIVGYKCMAIDNNGLMYLISGDIFKCPLSGYTATCSNFLKSTDFIGGSKIINT